MQFLYHAKTQTGEDRVGTIDATSKESAIELLQRNGLIVLAIKKKSLIEAISTDSIGKLLNRVPEKDVVLFSREISALFEAKVTVLESLRAMAEQVENPVFRDILNQVVQRVDAGASLSKALSEHKKVFSDFYISVVKSGEISGRLDQVFLYLADTLEREYYLKQKVKGALAYPIIVFFALIVVIFVMMVWIIPNLVKIYEETNIELPIFTKIIIGISHFFQSYWFIMIPLFFGIVIAFLVWKKSDTGKPVWDRVKIKFPILGIILKKYYIARFADSLSTLVKGGLPIIKSLEVSRSVVGNTVYQSIIDKAIESVKRGGSISVVFKDYKSDIPPMVTQMIAIGEKSGKLDSALKTVSNFYHKEVQNSMDNLVTIIEPFFIVFLGVVVAILLVAILMPMYNLTSVI